MGFLVALVLGVIIGWVTHRYLPPGIVDKVIGAGQKLVAGSAGVSGAKPAPKPIPANKPQRKVKTNGSSSAAGRSISSASDDLKKIDGIGPKIADLLKEDGIQTYTDLASANSGRLKEILSKAGSRYRMADPSSWQKQAVMAKKGDWDGLKALKQQLKQA